MLDARLFLCLKTKHCGDYSSYHDPVHFELCLASSVALLASGIEQYGAVASIVGNAVTPAGVESLQGIKCQECDSICGCEEDLGEVPYIRIMEKDIIDLYEFALIDKGKTHKGITLCKMPINTAQFIYENYNIDLFDYKLYLDASIIWHIHKQHGNNDIENARGQIAVKVDDFLLIQETLTNPNKIEYLGINKRQLEGFSFEKIFKETTKIITEVRKGKKVLSPVTIYKKANT